MMREIEQRRSIRKYQDRAIPEADIRAILESGVRAPSAKNRQPWKFIVAQGSAKREMLAAFSRGIDREAAGDALLPASREHLPAARHTVEILHQAPVVVLVVNALGKGVLDAATPEERIYTACNLQSISAAIENMLLEAQARGIGSLWVCDLYFAFAELKQWLGADGDLVAMVALGYPDEAPAPRPRKPLDCAVEWRR